MREFFKGAFAASKKVKLKYWVVICAGIVFLAVSLPVILMVIPFPLAWKIGEVNAQPTNVRYVETGDVVPYLYKADENGNFTGEDLKIITFTDTHFEGKLARFSKNSFTIEMMKKNIETEKPDLVIFTGDIVTDAYTKNRLTGLAEVMEAYQVYWAPIYGNHDGEKIGAPVRKEITKIWSKYPHCLVRDGGVDGSGNYMINVKTAADTVSETLVFMDTGNRMSKADRKKYGIEENSYDYIKPSQIEWYKNNLAAIKNLYGDVKSLLFIHIPLVEYTDAYLHGQFVYGRQREEVCSSDYNSGMFVAIKEAGSTQAIFCGHDHVNDFDYIYQGVHFVYLQKSGYVTYDLYTAGFVKSKSERRQGTNRIIIKADGSFTNEPLLNTRF